MYNANSIQISLIEVVDSENVRVRVLEKINGASRREVRCAADEVSLSNNKGVISTADGKIEFELLKGGNVILGGDAAGRAAFIVSGKAREQLTKQSA